MLVLNRKISEKFWIGDFIQVAILGLDNLSVRVGINAPKSIPIQREELIIRDRINNFDFDTEHHLYLKRA